jgi:TPR repeat protein
MDQIDGMNFVKQFVKQWEKVKWEDLDDRDPEKIELIIQWAYHGDISACYQLGTHYLSGEMVRHNAGRAIFWLEKAAEQGNFLAQLKLGIVFFSNNQKTDVEKATHWMRCARRQASSEEEIDAVGQAYYDAAACGELVEYAYNMEKKQTRFVSSCINVQCIKM